MYHKAMLFRDGDTAEKIMAAGTPGKQKALGRQVKGFSGEVWEQHKEKIVEEGNWNKFCHAKEEAGLKEKLLETGGRELVEVGNRWRLETRDESVDGLRTLMPWC